MILVAVVTYREDFSQCNAYQSLAACDRAIKEKLIIINAYNGAAENRIEEYAAGLDYVQISATDNGGLAGGYNAAMDFASEAGITHVLFLNSDATFAGDFLEKLTMAIDKDQADFYYPELFSGGKRVSPFRKRGIGYEFYIIGFFCVKFDIFKTGLRFPMKFWLDGIDYWLSSEIDRRSLVGEYLGYKQSHNLSVIDQFHNIPYWRYENILISEVRFIAPHSTWQALVILLRSLAKCTREKRFDLLALPIKMLRGLMFNEKI